MAGQHWGERDGKPSPAENALIGIFSTIATFGFYGGLLLTAVALLRGETCTITRVTDGDTVRATCAGTAVNLRLNAVDTPETSQPYGPEATKAVAQLVLDREVTVQAIDVDRYGRTVARITLADGRDLGRELVKAGLAWWYRKYAPDDWLLKEPVAAARKNRRGLWADATAVAPWEWRNPVSQSAKEIGK